MESAIRRSRLRHCLCRRLPAAAAAALFVGLMIALAVYLVASRDIID